MKCSTRGWFSLVGLAVMLAGVGCSGGEEGGPPDQVGGADTSELDTGADVLDVSSVDTTEPDLSSSPDTLRDTGRADGGPVGRPCEAETARPVTFHTSESGQWQYALADEYGTRVDQNPSGRSDGDAAFLFGSSELGIAGAVVSRSYDASVSGATDSLYNTIRPAVRESSAEITGSVLPSESSGPENDDARASFGVRAESEQTISEFRNALVDEISPIPDENEASADPTGVSSRSDQFNIKVRSLVRRGEGREEGADDSLVYLIAVSDAPSGTINRTTLEMDSLRSPTNLSVSDREYSEECVVQRVDPEETADKVYLANEPALQSVAVFVDGESVPHDFYEGWTYYALDPWVRFHGDARLSERSSSEVKVTVAYRRAD
jgi:hypothetical protein